MSPDAIEQALLARAAAMDARAAAIASQVDSYAPDEAADERDRAIAGTYNIIADEFSKLAAELHGPYLATAAPAAVREPYPWRRYWLVVAAGALAAGAAALVTFGHLPHWAEILAIPAASAVVTLPLAALFLPGKRKG